MQNYRKIIADELIRQGRTAYSVTAATGLPHSVLTRFLRGQNVTHKTLERFCDELLIVMVPNFLGRIK